VASDQLLKTSEMTLVTYSKENIHAITHTCNEMFIVPVHV